MNLAAAATSPVRKPHFAACTIFMKTRVGTSEKPHAADRRRRRRDVKGWRAPMPDKVCTLPYISYPDLPNPGNQGSGLWLTAF